ncbi:S-layer homology domain-containing protein, partial [Candidatus Peregrinibacteria bacterium]|nr:S-layer homology domain-containing protein [Candidatus Peregrinibacteria bacterium]
DKVTLSGVTISEADLSAVSINVSALTGQSALAMGSESTVVMAGALDSPTQTFIITITDDAGNTSTTSSDAISVDNIAPIVSAACISVTGATGIGEAFKNSNTPQLSWDNNNDGQGGCADNVTDLAGVTPVVFNAANFRAVDTNKTATGLVNIYYALLSGALDAQDDSNNNVSVTVTDDAGNQTTRVGTANYRIDTNVPVLAEITPVAQSSSDTTPSYTFSSNDAGTITWGGGCRSLSNIALAQEMIINLDSDGAGGELSSGTYDACTITVTDSVGNISTPLTISEFTIDLAPPVISEVTVTPAASGATMIWTTNEMASSFARYYFIEGRKWTTAEADVNPKKIDHSLIVENLLPCTVYQYKLWSRDAAGNLGSSIASTFTTRGCRGAATIVRAQTTEVVSRDTGGSANLNGDVVLQIPPAYDASVVCDVDNGAVFQLKELEKSSVTMDIGTPENADNAISTFDFSAYCNYNEKVTSFEEPIDVTVTYEEGDISGLDESLLRIYRYNEVTSRWDQLQNCGTPDTVNHTITCETTNLSTFGIFAPDAPVIAAPAPAPQVSSGGSGGGGVSKLLLQQIENELAKNRTSDNEKGGDELKAAAPEVKEEICTTKLKDIEKHWSKGYVETLECKGIVKGKKNGTFAPDTPITRSELTKIALLMGGYKANGDIFPPFDDIPSRHWAIPYISEAMRRKIVKGYEDGTFRPDANVTRAEAVKILLVAARIDVISISSNYFRDVGKNDWFRTFVNFAYFQGIIKGYRDGKFHPNQPITRAEAAKITMLVMKLAEEQKKQ